MKNRANRFKGNSCRNKDRRQFNYGDRKGGFRDNYSHSNRHKFHFQAKSRTLNNCDRFEGEVEDRAKCERTFGWESSRSGRSNFRNRKKISDRAWSYGNTTGW